MTAVSKTRRSWRPLGWLFSALCRSLFRGSALRRLASCTLHPPHLHRILAVAVLLRLTWSVASTLAVFPHELSYFNEFVGGSRNGHEHLLDANIDWGQDLLEFKRWYDVHPDARPLHFIEFGFVRPETAGIGCEPIPRASDGEGPPARSGYEHHAVPGWYEISVNELYGYKHFGDRSDRYAWISPVSPRNGCRFNNPNHLLGHLQRLSRSSRGRDVFLNG